MSYTLQGTKCNLSRYMYTHVKILVIFILKERLNFEIISDFHTLSVVYVISKNGLYSTIFYIYAEVDRFKVAT